LTRLFFVLVVAIAVVILLRAFRPAAPRAKAREESPARRMSRTEALEVLGLREGASREEMQTAYKNLIRKVHPDSPGGSGYLATKLNQAKQTLLD
jgi:hypothetical protein